MANEAEELHQKIAHVKGQIAADELFNPQGSPYATALLSVLASLLEEKNQLAQAAKDTTAEALSRPAPTGPVRYNLDSVAPSLVDTATPGLYQLEGTAAADLQYGFFLDSEGDVLAGLQGWLRHLHATFRSGHTQQLILNGLTKTGKSYVLNNILPAVFRNDPLFGVGAPQEVAVFRISMDELPLERGYLEMLRAFLGKLVNWVESCNLPLPTKTWKLAVTAYHAHNETVVKDAIEALVRNVETPALMLLDEVQMFFTPLTPGTTLVDVSAASDARRFFKTLVIKGAGNTFWAASGSGMGTAFISLGLMPTQGYAPLQHQFQVNMPLALDKTAKETCWNVITSSTPDSLPPELFNLAGDSAAMLVYMVREWLAQRPSNVQAFVVSHITDKLIAEAYADFSIVLSLLDNNQRRFLSDLCSVRRGVDMQKHMAPGLLGMLEPYTLPVMPGSARRHLNSPHHRQLLQMVVASDGELRLKWASEQVEGNLAYWEARQLLLEFGNTISTASQQGWSTSACARLKQSLQDMAAQLERAHGPAADWPTLPWFKRVLDSQYNARETAKVFRDSMQNGKVQAWEVLVAYQRMLRNCLGHEEFGQEVVVVQPSAFTAADIDLVDSWPLAPTLTRVSEVLGPVAAAWADDTSTPTPTSPAWGSSGSGTSSSTQSSSASISAVPWRGRPHQPLVAPRLSPLRPRNGASHSTAALYGPASHPRSAMTSSVRQAVSSAARLAVRSTAPHANTITRSVRWG